MRPSTSSLGRSAGLTVLALALIAAAASTSVASTARAVGPLATPPAGQPAPARLVALYTAHFTEKDEQTNGTWHLRIGPGHHLKVWNPLDGVANTPSFEGGPVSFRGDRMIFAKTTAEGTCTVGATYRWTYHNGSLRFRLIGSDGCGSRVITFTPHPWRRSS